MPTLKEFKRKKYKKALTLFSVRTEKLEQMQEQLSKSTMHLQDIDSRVRLSATGGVVISLSLKK
jgi:hypothetical protein